MRARPTLPLLAAACLSACASLTGSGSGSGSSSPGAALPKAIAAPFCRGDYEAAAAALTATGQSDAASHFYAAYIAELSGHGVQARPLYAALVSSGDRTPVALSCAGRATMPLNEAAASRLTAIALTLRSMDAATEPPVRLHAGLPETRPVRVDQSDLPAATPARAAPARPAPSKPAPAARPSAPVEVTAPATHDASGRWFAHLTSYFSAAEASGALAALGRRYPGIKDLFDTIEVTAKGRDTWRVGVRTSDWADADRLCVAIRAAGDYCRVIDTAE